jgi:hypothetical protein
MFDVDIWIIEIDPRHPGHRSQTANVSRRQVLYAFCRLSASSRGFARCHGEASFGRSGRTGGATQACPLPEGPQWAIILK